MQGGTETFGAVVNGTGNPAQTVTWSLSGNTKPGTSINASSGLLTVASDEAHNTTLTVRAVSTADTGKSKTATVKVINPPLSLSLTLNKTDYGIGEPLDISLAVTYADTALNETISSLQPSAFIGYDPLSAGIQSIKAKLGNIESSSWETITIKTLADRINEAPQAMSVKTIYIYGEDVSSSITIPSGKNIHLDSPGDERIVTRSGTGTMFIVEGRLTLNSNVSLRGHAENGNVLIRIDSGGFFTMVGGEISGNKGGNLDGGGVYVANGGDFNMKGGKISGNTASSSYNSGSGVTVAGGGTFTMDNGEISGNGGNTYTMHGAGVYVSGTFTMNNGKISDNNVEDYGGVYVNGGTFTMDNGEISGNKGDGVSVVGGGTSTFTMNDGKISGNTGRGVRVYGGTFDMNNGEISLNTGRGVLVVDGGTFNMIDGKISGNTTLLDGGGVNVSYGTFTMDGGEISGNSVTYSNCSGGGVYVYSGTFNMNGGKIFSNTIPAGSIGGGVMLAHSSSFTMTDGEIYSNAAANGGGVGIRVQETYSITFDKQSSGGIIYGSNGADKANNATGDHGHAVYLYTDSGEMYRNTTVDTNDELKVVFTNGSIDSQSTSTGWLP